MNSLTWFIYLGDICENIKAAIALTAICWLVVVLVAWISFAATENHKAQDAIKDFIKRNKYLTVISIIGLYSLVFIPSQQTVYMMAASEVAYQIANSPAGSETLNLVKNKINEVLKK